MQPIEIRIPGRYWDSFIYNGRLYLFTLSGEILTYRWDQVVESVKMSADCRPLFWQFLTRGQTWYGSSLQKILESPRVFAEVKSLTSKMSDRSYEISARALEEAFVESSSSPAHPHTDVEAYYNTLYISSSAGVYAATLTRKLSNNFRVLTDVPALRVACSYGSMAVAAGSEGIFDQALTSFVDWSTRYQPRLLSSRHCTGCSWASFDVVGTSGPRDAGFVAAFSKPKQDESESGLRRVGNTTRELLGLVDSGELFPSSEGLLFGSGNLLVMASRSVLHVDGWNPAHRRANQGIDLQYSLFSQNMLEVSDLTNDAIDGAATVFGIAVEMDQALLLRGVDGSISSFGQPVNWRTYPRSHRYLNQLHVTYDDCLSIFAFVDDYFISPEHRGPAVRRPVNRQGTQPA
jgi:hypothetical protein